MVAFRLFLLLVVLVMVEIVVMFVVVGHGVSCCCRCSCCSFTVDAVQQFLVSTTCLIYHFIGSWLLLVTPVSCHNSNEPSEWKLQ